MKKLILIPVLFLTIGLFAQQSKTDPAYAKKLKELYKNTVKLIQPEALNKELNNVVVFDTREKSEYDVSHIKGAKYAGYDHFDINSLKDIPKNKKIIVYCSVGWRSERIGEKLQKAGYTNVYNLYGGIFEWVNRGFKVYNSSGQTKKVHTYCKEWGKWVK